ncbi:MAG: hypothetical protein J6B87_00125 [Clostridia bacterium]|nr:hypothetical protein [Clostridia bacterium]
MSITTIMSLEVQEMAIMDELQAVAKEAIQAAEIVNRAYSNAFGICQKRVHVYHTEAFGEYYGDAELSNEGVWYYHDNWWGGRNWQVECTAEGIYKCYRAYLLRDQKMDASIPRDELRLAEVAGHFRDFVKELKEKKGK